MYIRCQLVFHHFDFYLFWKKVAKLNLKKCDLWFNHFSYWKFVNHLTLFVFVLVRKCLISSWISFCIVVNAEFLPFTASNAISYSKICREVFYSFYRSNSIYLPKNPRVISEKKQLIEIKRVRYIFICCSTNLACSKYFQ